MDQVLFRKFQKFKKFQKHQKKIEIKSKNMFFNILKTFPE